MRNAIAVNCGRTASKSETGTATCHLSGVRDVGTGETTDLISDGPNSEEAAARSVPTARFRSASRQIPTDHDPMFRSYTVAVRRSA